MNWILGFVCAHRWHDILFVLALLVLIVWLAGGS